MATLASIKDKKVCGGANEINTGKLGCLLAMSTPEHVIAVQKGFVIPSTTVFDLDYIITQTQKGIFIPIIGATNFEDVSAEDSYNTNPSGVERLNLQALPKYKLMYEEGHEFYRQLAKMTSYKSYDFIIGDDEGNWAMVENSDGDFKGFDMGQVTAELTKRKVKGGDNESKSMVFQFINRRQYDIDYRLFTAEELGFYAEDISSINGVALSFLTVPSDTDTVLSIQANLAMDNHTPVEGLAQADFEVLVNGTAVAIGGLTENTAGQYDITIPALSTADIVTINFTEATNNTNVLNVAGVLYRAVGIEEYVIAA